MPLMPQTFLLFFSTEHASRKVNLVPLTPYALDQSKTSKEKDVVSGLGWHA